MRSTKSHSPPAPPVAASSRISVPDPIDVVLLVAHGFRREAPAHDPAHRHVPRRIQHHDHLRHLHDRLLGAGERDPVLAREAHRLARDLHDVGVPRDGPERLVPGRLDVRDRRLGPQARPHVVRIAVARVAHRIDEVERIDVRSSSAPVAARARARR